MRRVEERLLSDLARCSAAVGMAQLARREPGTRLWTHAEVGYYLNWKRGTLNDMDCPSTLDEFDEPATAKPEDGTERGGDLDLGELLRGVERQPSPFEDASKASPKELDPLRAGKVYAWCRVESHAAPRTEKEVEVIAGEFKELVAESLQVTYLETSDIIPCIRSGSGAIPAECWAWHKS